MARNWTEPAKWDNAGTAPSETLKANGYSAGYKPPAPVTNYKYHKDQVCIEELQSAVDEVEAAIPTKTSQITNDSGFSTSDTTYSLEKSGKYIQLKASAGKSYEVEDSDTIYTHPTTSGNKHIPSGGASGQILRWSADGTAVWGDDNNAAPVTTSGDGTAYTAEVANITALTVGASFIMIPHVNSASTTPTLNVNSLGAKQIKRRLSNMSTVTQGGYSDTWLSKDKPFRVTYDGSYWIVEGMTKPAAADMYGTLAVAKGGTGATTAADALTNLGITFGTSDLTAGTSELATGAIYIVYE